MPGPALWRFEAIGTPWEIETDAPVPPGTRAAVEALIADFDRTWSRFRDDSVVSSLERRAGSVALPADAPAMFEAFLGLSEATGGAVNPLVGAALAHRGYDAELSLLDRGAIVTSSDWHALVDWSGEALSLAEPASIDVGALGKGRLVDLVVAVLSESITGHIVVDASGDIAVRGTTARIGLEHPFDLRRAIGVWGVTDAALCASAINRRAWGDGLHHVLDARTGEPVDTIAATWTVASDAMIADAGATALFFDGGPQWAHRSGVQWVRMFTDGRVQWSPDCGAELFTGQ